MICANDISSLKTNIGQRLGQRVIVKGLLGRSKTFEKEATLENTYPNFFRVKFDNEPGNATYTYGDVLTGNIQVDVFNGAGYAPLLPPQEQLELQKKKRII